MAPVICRSSSRWVALAHGPARQVFEQKHRRVALTELPTVERNQRSRTTLETFARYHFEQGLSKRQLSLDELFAPESLEAFKI